MSSISTNVVGDNPQAPGVFTAHYTPDQLIADSRNLVSEPILVVGGPYKRGQILGQRSVYPIAAIALAGNTGNGVVGNLSTSKTSEIGDYKLTATSDTVFALVDPEGHALGNVTVGTPFAGEIGVTVTAGATAFVAGDAFILSVSDATGVFVGCVKTATDGSADPVAILADDVLVADTVSAGGYVSGEFNGAALSYDASWNPALLFAALRKAALFIKSSVTAAPPSNNSAP